MLRVILAQAGSYPAWFQMDLLLVQGFGGAERRLWRSGVRCVSGRDNQTMSARMEWPEGKAFAFTIFDDPDSQTLEEGREVYSLIRDAGLRTTKGVWPVRGPREPSDHGGTCAEPDYRAWVMQLQSEGFEVGLHNATLHTSTREETIAALERFRDYFGSYPSSMANHYYSDEGIYWGDARVSGSVRLLYNALTRWKNSGKYFGHVSGHPYFWGDLCRDRIRYVRNFAFAEINTLAACPFMPYHDPARPYVNQWYACSEGSNRLTFNQRIAEKEQDRLEEEGGACIMYTHFGHGYTEGNSLNPRFRELITRLGRKNGWFVPVTQLLDYLASRNPGSPTHPRVITAAERNSLERRWLMHKIRFGTA